MFDILLKYSMLNNFGGAFTLSSIDNESWIDIQCMQLCISATNKAQEMQHKKAQAYARMK